LGEGLLCKEGRSSQQGYCEKRTHTCIVYEKGLMWLILTGRRED